MQQTPNDPVKDAWINPGPRPDLHRQEQARLRRRWPALYHALEARYGTPPTS